MIFGDRGEPVDFVFLEANNAFIGNSKIEKNLLGERASKILSSDSWKTFIVLLGKHWPTISSGKSVRFEYFSADLKKWFAVLSYSPENGYFASIFEDITGRKKAEQALVESEERFRKAFSTSPDAFMITTLSESIILECNDAFLGMFGYSRQEVEGKRALDLNLWADPSDRERIALLLKKEGKVVNKELFYKRKNGEIFPVLFSVSLLETNNQKLSLIIARDISVNKKAEAALRESEATYKSLINGMNETAWVFDCNGNFVDVNTAAGKTLGYSKEELLTMGLKDIDKAFNQEEFENHVRSIPAVGTKVFERVHTAKDGTEIPVEISSSLITYHGQQATLSIARNITERKKAEEALLKSETNLKNLINGMNDTVWVIDFNRNFIDLNDAAVKALGYSRDELLSLGIKGIDNHLSYEQSKKILARLIRDGNIVFETIHTTKNGLEIPVEISSSLITYNGKQAILSIARNITERKKGHEAL